MSFIFLCDSAKKEGRRGGGDFPNLKISRRHRMSSLPLLSRTNKG
jgi:hypothetical protein